jgi:hypothetical protein
VIAVLFLGSCKVTLDKVEKWKRNGDAPRLKKCLADKKQKMDVRIAAGLALFELGRYYGVEVMLQRVKERSASESTGLADGIAAKLLGGLKGTGEDAIRVKDGLFSVWASAGAETRTKIENELITWLMNNYASVAKAGEHSAKKIFEIMGEKAGIQLARNLQLDNANLFEMATLVKKLAPADERDALVDRFAKTLTADARQQGHAQKLFAIGQLCGPKAVAFLQGLVLKGYSYTIRRNAIIGLRQCPHKSSLKVVFRLLGDLLDKAMSDVNVELPGFKDRKPGILTQSYELVEAVKAPKVAKAGLLRLVTAHGQKPLKEENQRRKLLIRMKAGQYLIYLHKVEGLKMVLDKLPTEDEYPSGYLGIVVYAIKEEFSKTGREVALQAVRAALNSPSWVARIIAVETLALMGNKNVDLPLLQKLANDKAKLKGWKVGATVGERASVAVKKLENR